MFVGTIAIFFYIFQVPMADRNLGYIKKFLLKKHTVFLDVWNFSFLLPVFFWGVCVRAARVLFVCLLFSLFFARVCGRRLWLRSSDASARRAGSEERTPLARSDQPALRSVLPIVSRYISAVVFIVPCLSSMFCKSLVSFCCRFCLLPCFFLHFSLVGIVATLMNQRKPRHIYNERAKKLWILQLAPSSISRKQQKTFSRLKT